MKNYATQLDNVLLMDKKLPEGLNKLRSGIHEKLDLNGMNPNARFTQDEVKEMVSYFLNSPCSDSFELAQYVLKVYFHGDKDSSKYTL